MSIWGLGIEHEMRIRFKNKTSQFSFDEKDEYIFIDSNILIYYFKIYETLIMKNYIKYISNNSEKQYYNKIILKTKLYEQAINKNPISLNITNKELINYYLMIYTLFNAPLLFFSYYYNNKYLIPSIYNNSNLSFDKLYSNELEIKVYNDLKDIFINNNISDFVMHVYNGEMQIFFKCTSNNNNRMNINMFINKLNNNIEHLRNIFTHSCSFNYERKFYKTLYILYNNNIPHIDHTYMTQAIEFKTIYYKNLSYEKSLNDLIDLEETFFKVINNIPIIKNLVNKYGELTYHNIGSIKKTICIIDIIALDYQYINEDYTGSYHIWITVPHNDNISLKKFINIHTNLANKLQLLEPILSAHYSSPSYNAQSNTESKSSLRQFLNSYSNYGTTDISLMNGTNKHEIWGYYLSKNDIINNTPILYPNGNTNLNKIYNNKGKCIINYHKLTTRNITNNIFSLIDKGNNESNDINIKNYFSLIFEKTKIRAKHGYLKLGSDIRTRRLNDIFYPLNKKWIKYLILKNNKLIEIYYNKTINKFSYKRVISNKKVDKIGIEFRIFDHFPTHYLNQILGLLAPIVIDCIKTPTKNIKSIKDTYVSKQFWHNEMAKVINLGYKYTLSNTYITNLEKEFNLKIKKSLLYTEDILKILYHKLSKRYLTKLYNKIKFNSHIDFVNFNKKAWNEILEKNILL